MPNRSSKPKRPKDISQLAKLVTDIATGEAEDVKPTAEKNPAAVELGRKGGLKGGKARASALTATQRKRIAKAAARARWSGNTRKK